MSIFRVNTLLAAAGVVPNLLNGSKFEFLSAPAVVTLYATDFGNAAASELTFTLGNVVVAENIPLNTSAVAGTISTLNDLIGSGVGAPGDRIQIAARNTDAAATTTVQIMLHINEL
jgi:hypothetical protein